MKEQEIIQVCRRLKTLKPLLQAIRFGAIKFEKIPRSAEFHFAMKSKGGCIVFEHDNYFYVTADGEDFDDLKFGPEAEDDYFKFKIYNMMRRINDGLRGI